MSAKFRIPGRVPAPETPLAVSAAEVPAAVLTVIRRLMRQAGTPGLSLAVTRHDGLLYAAGFGHADLTASTPARPDTAYLWFSMSKIATATAALALADTGTLDLDAPVDEYLPAGVRPRSRGRRPAVRHLLAHTAGLGNPPPIRWVRPAPSEPPDPEQFLRRRLRHSLPRHRVGGRAHYSNLGYLVLGQVLANAAHRPFTDLVTDSVLRPAGMRRTGYTWPADRPCATGYVRLPRLATPGLRLALPRGLVGPRHGAHQSLRPFLVDGAAYGGLVGDVLDAARLSALHLGDGALDGTRVISADAARRMRTIATPGPRFDLGLGWFRPAAARGHTPRYVEHLGSGGGYNNVLRIYPDLDLGVAIMTNDTKAFDHDSVCDAISDEAASSS